MTLLLLKLERAKKVVSLCFFEFYEYYAIWFGVYSLLRYSPLQKKSASYIFPDYSQTLPPLFNFLFQAINLSPGDFLFIYLFILNGICQNVDVLTEQFNFCVFDVFFC